MKEAIDRNDPLPSAAVDAKDGAFEEAPDGYIHYVPSEEKLTALNCYFEEEILAAENDHIPYFSEIADNYDAYYGKGGSAAGDDPVLQLPIVNRCIDLMVSWYVLQTLRQTPVVSFKPYHDQKYSVPVPVEGMMGAVAETEMTGEELATAYERGFDKLLRERCDFRRWFNGIVKEAHIAGRAWSKVYYRRDTRSVSIPNTKKNDKGLVSAFYESDAVVARDDACRFERVPVTSILTPLDQQHPQKSDWIAEKLIMSNTELRQRFAGKSFPLVDKEQMEDILQNFSTAEYRSNAERRISGQADKAVTLMTKRHVLYMVWFDHPVRMKEPNPMTGEEGPSRIVMTPLCGLFHRDARKLLCIYKNPYAHKQRPFALFMEEDSDENEFGMSVVGKIKKHAALISQMLHLDIQNAVQSVNVNWLADPSSPGYLTLVNEEDFPGRVIPRRTKDEIEPVKIGRPHGGLGEQMGFVSDDLYRTVNLSIYEEGMHVPGRTAAASIKQVMDAGYQKPMKTMLALSQFTADTLRLWMEVKRQYEPLGETFAHVDDATREIMEAVIRYPTGVPLDMFRISLTASDEFMARDEDSEERMMIYNLVTQNNQTIANIISGLADLGAPPSIVNALGDMANAQIDALKYVIEAVRKDSDRFVLDKKAVAAILQEREMAAMAQQQAMMPQQGGMMNGEPTQGPSGPAQAEPGMAGGGAPPVGPPGAVPGG